MTVYAKIRPLTEPRQADVEQTFHRLAGLLSESGEQAAVRFTLLAPTGDRAHGQWTLGLSGWECRVLDDDAPRACDAEFITREATWWQIAEGRLSPLDAFVQGRLRVLGDTELATRLLRKASGGEGVFAICGE